MHIGATRSMGTWPQMGTHAAQNHWMDPLQLSRHPQLHCYSVALLCSLGGKHCSSRPFRWLASNVCVAALGDRECCCNLRIPGIPVATALSGELWPTSASDAAAPACCRRSLGNMLTAPNRTWKESCKSSDVAGLGGAEEGCGDSGVKKPGRGGSGVRQMGRQETGV
jgi:hypothetical protein